jgi:hypothetical protein
MSLIVILCIVVVLVLVIKVIALKARLEGFREAQQFQSLNGAAYGNSPFQDLIKALAIIGLLALLLLCLYIGTIASAFTN